MGVLNVAIKLGFNAEAIFYGVLRDESSMKEQVFTNLMLDIGAAINLIDALEAFMGREKLTARCDCSLKDVLKERRFSINMLPPVVIITLKRFLSKNNNLEKNGEYIVFPLEIDFSPFLVPELNKVVGSRYLLQAFIEHVGTELDAGHYVCFIRIEENLWYEFNDLQVTQVPEDFVLLRRPYILFYNTAETVWFSEYFINQALAERSKMDKTAFLNTS
ncbi:ubiquitin carboxyl-terminal hydrolase 21 [Phtheirospermum japonicum]|uniref:ubiquitinyl hydrolase 1 n=1 Tax=Phtheirospermum japonicum TaxID=374723 RepID=A0A830CCY6_9LAMI|nr:ubiquitin carboxyl-terminal hydrolase 21 [Phtheirospermum japonicum]